MRWSINAPLFCKLAVRCFWFCRRRLVEVSFSQLAKCLSLKSHRFVNEVFRLSFNGLAFDGFPADASWEQTPLHAQGVGAVCNVAVFFSFPAPYTVALIEGGILGAFKGLAHWRTRFWLSQQAYTSCVQLVEFIDASTLLIGYSGSFNINFFA